MAFALSLQGIISANLQAVLVHVYEIRNFQTSNLGTDENRILSALR